MKLINHISIKFLNHAEFTWVCMCVCVYVYTHTQKWKMYKEYADTREATNLSAKSSVSL